jgi:hypothetical protein
MGPGGQGQARIRRQVAQASAPAEDVAKIGQVLLEVRIEVAPALVQLGPQAAVIGQPGGARGAGGEAGDHQAGAGGEESAAADRRHSVQGG